MRGPVALVKSYATIGGVAAATTLAVLLALLVRHAVIPPYTEMTGFIPFDAQPRLSHVVISIELGAFKRGVASEVYLLFAVTDFLSAIASAWAFTLGWIWLFTKIPSRIFSFLTRGGILMLPFYVLVLDGVAKGGFYRLVRGLNGESYSSAIEFCVALHRLTSALTDVRNYLTAAFILAAVAGFILRRIRT